MTSARRAVRDAIAEKNVGDAIARKETAGDAIANKSGEAAMRCHRKNKAVAADVIATPKTVSDAIAEKRTVGDAIAKRKWSVTPFDRVAPPRGHHPQARQS